MHLSFKLVTSPIYSSIGIRGTALVYLQTCNIQRQFDRTFHSAVSTPLKTCQYCHTKNTDAGQVDSYGTTRSISTTRSALAAKVSLPHQTTSSFPPILKQNNPTFALSRLSTPSNTQSRQQSTNTQNNMATTFSKETIREGNGTQRPKAGDTVVMEYTGKESLVLLCMLLKDPGWLYDPSQENNRGTQ